LLREPEVVVVRKNVDDESQVRGAQLGRGRFEDDRSVGVLALGGAEIRLALMCRRCSSALGATPPPPAGGVSSGPCGVSTSRSQAGGLTSPGARARFIGGCAACVATLSLPVSNAGLRARYYSIGSSL